MSWPDDIEQNISVLETLARAMRLHRSGQLGQADAAYRLVLAVQPRNADALYQLSLLNSERGDDDAASRYVEEALSLRPNSPEAHSQLAVVRLAQSSPRAAESACRSALDLKPDYAPAHLNLGNALLWQSRVTEAEAAYRKALMFDPRLAEAYTSLGKTLMRQDRLPEAEAAFRDALAVKPDLASAYRNLGAAISAGGRPGDSVTAFNTALALEPDNAAALCYLADALTEQGDHAKAVETYRRVIADQPDNATAHSKLIQCLALSSDVTTAELNAECRRWDRCHAAFFDSTRPVFANSREVDRPLRVGYMAAAMPPDIMARFVRPVIARHDRRHFELSCYAAHGQADGRMTARLKSLFDHWHDVDGLNSVALAGQIRDDRIDILVDLSGHRMEHWLGAFAKNPAPVQVSWHVVADATGLVAIDYRLSDEVRDPTDAPDDSHPAETVLHLPDGALSYEPEMDAPLPAPIPKTHTGPITFGSFNEPALISEAVLRTWARLLQAMPDAHLLLTGSGPYRDEATRAWLLENLAKHGVAVDRVEIIPGRGLGGRHLPGYHRVDVALDTFPCNGVAAACDALWMGVPVVTLIGDRTSARTTASVLARLGLDELATSTEDAYVEAAAGLAENGGRRRELRRALRPKMRASALCDQTSFARQLEAAYREMWRHWCNHGRL